MNFLGKSDKNIGIVSNMITELKKYNITYDILNDCNPTDTLTKLKLEDIKLIFRKYQEKLQGNFIDENDILTMISPKILEASLLENSLIYIDDFYGFTPQEYTVFENILKKTENVTVGITCDSLSMGEKEKDIFYFNKVFGNKLIKLANDNGIEVEEINLLDNHRNESDDLKYLEKSFSTSSYVKPYCEKPENLKLFLANNSYSELEYVSNEILRLVKEENYKYNEIAIISDDLDTYNLEAKVIFDKYDIPIFIDEKKDLNGNLLIKYVLAILEIFSKNWSFEAVFNYIKLGMYDDISDDELNLFENYCRKWGIKSYKWLKPFTIEPKNTIQDRLEEIRKKITEPLENLRKEISEDKTAENFTKNLYEFVIENKIDVILNKKLNKIHNIEISNEYNTSYKIFTDVLDNIVSVFGNEKMSFEEYKNLVQIGFNESKLGIIPATQEQVVLGDSKRSRNSNIKVSFIVGINDGKFPSVDNFEGFLNDVDKENLKEENIELSKSSTDSMYEKNFEIYNILGLASQKLYLSYCSQDRDGKGLRPSILIKKIKRLFPKLEEKSDIIKKDYFVTNKLATFDDSISVYRDYLDGNNLSDEWKTVLNYYNTTQKDRFDRVFDAENYTNNSEKITRKNIDKLYGKKFFGSVSKLEKYRECPFSFHLQYGLKLKEKEEFQMQSLNTGSFMHQVIDEFFETLEEEGIDIKTISSEKLEEIVNRIIDDLLETSNYYIFSSSAKFKTLTKKLKKVTLNSVKYIVYTLQNSEFELYGHELEFSDKSKYKPIEFELEDGRKVEIIGKIDRLDIGKLDEKTYVRIIDYKSSIKSFNMDKFSAGLQIQLITYLDEACKQDNFDPAGFLYSGLIDSKFKESYVRQELAENDIKNAIRKNFRMKGYVLANIDVVRMMDNNLKTSKKSDIIPVELTNSEGFHASHSKVLKEEEFDNMQNEVRNIIKDISTEILDGNIDIKPYSYKNETGCTYCKYSSICRFNPNQKDNTYFEVKASS